MTSRNVNIVAAVVAAAALAGPAGAQGAAWAGAAPISASGSVSASAAVWEDRGSALFPAGSAAARSGSVRADLRAEAGEAARCALECSLAVDAASGAASFAVRELWAEIRPAPTVSIRAGRQRLGFGSGFGWNPSNDLEPRRDASDPAAARRGADAAQLRVDAADAVGLPLSLTLVGLPPPGSPALGLSDSKLGAQLYALLGPLELMAAGSASGFGRGEPDSWLAGGWATLGAGPVVLGLEAALRRRTDLFRPGPGGLPAADRGVHGAAAATATLRAGDFVIVAEAAWDGSALDRGELDAILASPARAAWLPALLTPGAVGDIHALGRIAWASGDWSAAALALLDARSLAWTASAEAAVSVGGSASARVKATMPGSEASLARDELGLAGRGLAFEASISAYY